MSSDTASTEKGPDMKLFWGCFIALVATSFVFSVRGMIIDDWANHFDLSESQKGEILGVGMWPFAITIVGFSLIIDRVGYRNAALFAIICHVGSVILMLFATGYWSLWLSNFTVALGNGTVEAFINPVVATMFRKDKTKWLNILHAGWPMGLVLGGLVSIGLGETDWQWKLGLVLVPIAVYTAVLLRCKFPVSERIAAGVSYRDMIKEVGLIGFLVIAFLMSMELLGVSGKWFGFEAPTWVSIALAVAVGGIIFAYCKSLGSPMFLVILLTMGPLATTELGTDGWMTELMKPEMVKMSLDAGWVLVYASAIMTVLRFCAGPIIKVFSPLGLLVVSALIACLGLIFLSKATGIMILAAATFYGFGKTFLWSTTLGVVAERFPKGGALTLNSVSAVGVLFLGIIGSPAIGFYQDVQVDRDLKKESEAVYAKVADEPRSTVFDPILGKAPSLDEKKVKALPAEEMAVVEEIQTENKKSALRTIAILPAFMLIIYLGLFLYFKAKGGYKPVELEGYEPLH